MKRRTFFIVLLLLFSITANATIYYVNSITGTNIPGNGTIANPWKTITYALNQISGAGHTVYVAAGTYNTSLGETFPIVMKNGVSLSGAGEATTIIDADGSQRVMNCIGITDPSTFIEGFTITGGSLGSNYSLGGGIFISAGTAMTLRNNTISNNSLGTWGEGGGIYMINSSPNIINNTISLNSVYVWGKGIAIAIYSSTPLIERNRILNNVTAVSPGYSCIYVSGSSSSPLIRNNVIAKNEGSGIFCNAGTPTIINNTISDNSEHGISISNTGLPDSVLNNVISFNSGYGIYESGTSNDPGKVWYNLFYVNGGGLYYDNGSTSYFTASSLNSGVSECKNNIDEDPAFTDRTNGDYHIRLYSLSIDAGDPNSPFVNEPSPNGNRINLGAYGNTAEATITATPPVLPADLYVNASTGSNVTGDGSYSTPWKTITYTLSQITGPGHIIHVAAGTYNTAVGESFPIVIKNGVSVSGEGEASTIIDAGGTQRVLTCTGITDPSTFIDGFTITGGSLGGNYEVGGGIYISAGTTLTLRNSNIIDNYLGSWGEGGGIYVINSAPKIINNTISLNSVYTAGKGIAIAIYSSAPLIEGNIIFNNISVMSTSYNCIYVDGSSSAPKIRNNVIAKNDGSAIYCNAGIPTMINNTVSDNELHGIYITGTCKPDSVINNIISYNSGYGIYESGTSNDPGKVWYNLFYSNVSGLYRDEGTTDYFTETSLNSSVPECKNNLSGDPVFINKTSNNYHIFTNSPAINAGDPNSPPDPDGSRADIGAFYFIPPPDPPTALAATGITHNSFQANWAASATATGYNLDVATDAAFTLFVAGFNNKDVANVITFPVTGLNPNTVYYYRLRAYNATGSSVSGNVSNPATLQIPAPGAPVAIAATTITQNSFLARWNSSSTATGYYLDVALENTFTSFVSGFNNKDAGNVTSCSVTGLSANTNYYYRVRAYNAGGSSASGNTITVTTLQVLPPAAPSVAAATGVTLIGFTANWSTSATATGYYLDVATNAGFTNYVTGYNNKDVGNLTSFGVTGLASNTTYYYRVRAYNAGGSSSNSASMSVTTLPDAPSPPAAIDASGIGQTNFIANWNSAATATGYYLDVATDNSFTSFVTSFNNKNVFNVTSFSVEGLTANTTYYYRVRAYNSGGTSSSSNTISLTTLINPPSPPSPPTANSATNISQLSLTANWNSSATATGYYLDVALNISFSTFVSGYNNKDVYNVTSFGVTGLTANTTYYYRVRAYNSGGTSSSSGTITAITLPNPPTTPVCIAATSIAQTSFTANWNSSVTATGYFLDVATDNFFTSFVTGYNNKDVLNVTGYNISGLTANTTYYYRVRAYNSGGTSSSSNTITTTTLLNPPATPVAPTASSATGITQTGFTARWSSSANATGYRIDVSIDNSFNTYVSGYYNKDVGLVTSTLVTGLSAKTNFYYRVRAYNSNGTSGNSNIILITTLPVPPASPAGLSASSCNNNVTLTWNTNSEEDFLRYRIYGGTTTNPTTKIDSTGNQISETTKILEGLTSGQTYYFRVTAVLSPGVEGGYSNSATVKVKTGVIPKIKAKWNDVLITYNQGDSITGFQWYNGSTVISNATSQYYVTNKQAGYYHVLTTDKNGCMNTSNIIYISNSKSVTVFPNPAKTSFTLSLNSETVGKAVVSIYNATGIKVLEYITEKQDSLLYAEISVDNLPEGTYLLKLTVNEEDVTISRIVVIK